VQREVDTAALERELAAAERRLAEGQRDGIELSHPRFCLEQARAADRPAKAFAWLRRLEAQASVRVARCGLAEGGGVEVEVATSLQGAVGVVRAVPLPHVVVPLAEVAPGRYRGTIDAGDLVAYDYAARRHRPYRGPLQVIGNLWRGRTLAQFARRLRYRPARE
jgi:hypothetical protein